MALTNSDIALIILAVMQLIVSATSFAVGIWYTSERGHFSSASFLYGLFLVCCLVRSAHPSTHRIQFLIRMSLGITWLCGFEVALRTNPVEFPRKHRVWRASLCFVVLIATINDLGIFQIQGVIAASMQHTNSTIQHMNTTISHINHASGVD
jgi:hypothetical protein